MSTVYLIPSVLHEEATESIPAYILDAVRKCSVIFAENERTARRYLKSLDKTIVIDDYEWFTIHKLEEEELNNFRLKLKEDKNVAIISEAGCPGVADPGQILIAAAHSMNAAVKPLVGPSSILLALMASGMNGQQFEFIGYLPIDTQLRERSIKDLENDSLKKNSTKIFIETPYRNNQLLESLLRICNPKTRLCIAVNLTAPDESVRTLPLADWKKLKTDIHKKATIFLLYAG